MAKPVKDTGLRVEGLNTLFRTLNKMGKDANNEVRDASTKLAGDVIRDVTRAAAGTPEQSAMAVFKVYRDRVPKLGFPGGAPVAVSGKPAAGQFFYGTEFGGRNANTTQQFRPHRGKQGYFFYPTFRAKGTWWAHGWFQEIMDVVDAAWDKGARKAKAASP